MKYLIHSFINYRTEDGAIWLNSDERSAITLTITMNRLLSLLLERKGQVVPRDEILENIWDKHGLRSSNNTLNKYISELRKLFVGFGIEEECIITIPRVGFMFSSDIQAKIMAEESAEIVDRVLEDNAKTESTIKSIRHAPTPVFHYLLLVIVIAVLIFSLMVYLQRLTPRVIGQKETPLFFLFNYESCPVFTLQNNSTAFQSLKQDIFINLVKQKGIKCLPDTSFVYQSSESYLYGHKGRNFISRCTSDKKGYISCLNYYWSGYKNDK